MKTARQSVDSQLQATIETHEARAWGDFYRCAGAEVAQANGIGVCDIGPVTVAIVAGVDMLSLNRVIGLGIDPDLDAAATLDTATAAYSAAGARRFFVQLAPDVARRLTPELEVRGFRYHNDWMKLYRGVEPPPPVASDLRVEQIDRDRASVFAGVFVTAFEWSPGLGPWVGGLVGRPGWRHYLAYDGETPVATAAMYMEGKNAWIDFASTLGEYRGRGAQSALTARRIEDCARLGAELMVVETSAVTPEKGAPSLRNMQRMGFEVAYHRPNYTLDIG